MDARRSALIGAAPSEALASMAAAVIAEHGLDARELRKAMDKERLWKPNPGPQQMAVESPAYELFYGGAAGGGKSDALLGITHQHRKSRILRRQLTDLDNMVSRSHEMWHGLGSYNQSKMIWAFADGRTVRFAACKDVNDKRNFQGKDVDYNGFDEITHFMEEQYLFIINWTRSTFKGNDGQYQRCRIVVTGNPPDNEEGEWVKDRWAAWLDPHYPNPAKPGELRWFARIDGKDTEVPEDFELMVQGKVIRPKSRTFIPALLKNNPYLMETDYLDTIMQLPEPFRSQQLYGDFGFVRRDSDFQVIPTSWLEAAVKRWKTPEGPIKVVGVDVAQGGADNTVIARLHGNVVSEPKVIPGERTPTGELVATYVKEDILAHGGSIAKDGTLIQVDAIGYGSASSEAMRRNGMNVRPINFANATKARDKSGRIALANVRAEAYWRLREALEPGNNMPIALPPNQQLRKELLAMRYEMKGRSLYIESKQELKKRLGKSPDLADAVALAVLYSRHHPGRTRVLTKDPKTGYRRAIKGSAQVVVNGFDDERASENT